MANKMRYAAAVLLLLILPFANLRGQEKRKEKEDIRVPKEVLVCPRTAADFEMKMKEYFDWLDSFRFPHSAAAMSKEYPACKEIHPGAIKEKLYMMKAVATDPDLEEATRLPRTWYMKIYNAALELVKASEILRGVYSVPNEKRFLAAKQQYIAAISQQKKIYADPPKKIAKEAYEEICKQNKARRKKDYIVWYKKQQAEAAKKYQAATDKASAKKKPKKKPAAEETEE